MSNPSGTTMVDGTFDFSGGVNSIKVRTVQSQLNPHGLNRNELAWLYNATVRDGGITQRTGWQPIGKVLKQAALFQGGILYEPPNAFPYHILSIAGHIIKFDPNDPGNVVDLSQQFGLFNPATVDQAFFCQGDRYLVIQAGDFVTNPLFWDDNILRRSKGITNPGVAPGTPGVNEIPAGGPMDYSWQRLWWSNGRQYNAGDIFGGPSGVVAPSRADAILNVTENPLVLGGDGFSLPTNAGNIRALFHNANLNAPLGQGQLLIGTRKAVYAQQVPLTRNDWIASSQSNQPAQVVVQLFNGPVNDRSLVKVNGDVFYQSLEPGIRSIFASVRNFGQWGNVDLSSNIERLTQFNDRALMRFASGMLFDNRMWQTQLPEQTQFGVVSPVIAPLDYVPISTFNQQNPPNWEGMYEGLKLFQIWSGDYGGRERAFGLALAQDGSMEMWEFTLADRFQNGDNRVKWVIEFPSFNWQREYELKQLASGELWVDRLFGNVEFELDYRVDSDNCWIPWDKWKQCVARSTCEDVMNPICYPLTGYRTGYYSSWIMPKPPYNAEVLTSRPSDIGYEYQPRLTITGWCRIRGILLHALPVDRALYDRRNLARPS